MKPIHLGPRWALRLFVALTALLIVFLLKHRSKIAEAPKESTPPAPSDTQRPANVPKAPPTAERSASVASRASMFNSYIATLPESFREASDLEVVNQTKSLLVTRLRIDKVPVEYSQINFEALPDGNLRFKNGSWPKLEGDYQPFPDEIDFAKIKKVSAAFVKSHGAELLSLSNAEQAVKGWKAIGPQNLVPYVMLEARMKYTDGTQKTQLIKINLRDDKVFESFDRRSF